MHKEIIYIWMKLIKLGSKHKILEEKKKKPEETPKTQKKDNS